MKIQMKGMSLMVILLMLALTVQAAALRGTVTDKATKEPLIGAAVQLSGTSTGAIPGRSVTCGIKKWNV